MAYVCEREKKIVVRTKMKRAKKLLWKLCLGHGRFPRKAECTYLKVELPELLLGIDVGVSRRDYRTGGERHLSIWRLAVIRSDGGQAAVVSELLVQDGGGGMAG